MIMIGDVTEDPRVSLLSAMVQSAFEDNLENKKSRIQQDNMKVSSRSSSSSSSSQKLGWTRALTMLTLSITANGSNSRFSTLALVDSLKKT